MGGIPEDILLQSPVFASCDREGVERLARLGRVERFDNPSLLAAQGGTPEVIRHIRKGRVDLLRIAGSGQAARIPIIAGGWATWLGCLYNQPIEHELWSSADAEYVAFPSTAVRELIESNPKALKAVLAQVGGTLRLMIGWSHAHTLLTKEQQLVFILQAIGMKSADGEGHDPIRISHEHLGQIGIGSRQLVGRLLEALEQRGLVEVGYGTVRLVSRKAAADFISI